MEKYLQLQTDKRLPEFTGPVEGSYEVSQKYVTFLKLLQPLQKKIAQINFSPRQAWRIHMEDGVVLELGREKVEARLGVYVSAYDHIVSQFKEQDYICRFTLSKWILCTRNRFSSEKDS